MEIWVTPWEKEKKKKKKKKIPPPPSPGPALPEGEERSCAARGAAGRRAPSSTADRGGGGGRRRGAGGGTTSRRGPSPSAPASPRRPARGHLRSPPRTATRRRETGPAATAKQKNLLTNERTESRHPVVPLPPGGHPSPSGTRAKFRSRPPAAVAFHDARFAAARPAEHLRVPPPARSSRGPRGRAPARGTCCLRGREKEEEEEAAEEGRGGREGGRAERRGAATRPLPARPRRAAPPGVTARHPGGDGKRCQVL